MALRSGGDAGGVSLVGVDGHGEGEIRIHADQRIAEDQLAVSIDPFADIGIAIFFAIIFFLPLFSGPFILISFQSSQKLTASQPEACCMKTTIDLPPDLVREMKLLAVHEGRKLKDVAADLLKRGLSSEKNADPGVAARKGAIKLPLFPSPTSAPATRLSTADLLAIEQETLHQEDLQRLGLSL